MIRKRSVLALWAACLVSAGCLAAPAGQADGIRVACVGDSITFGAGIKDRATQSYPAQLQRALGEGWQVKNFGVNGATLLKKGDNPYWRQKAYKAALAFQPNVVVIKLGTNDTKPQNWKHKDEFAADAEALADSFAALPSQPKVYLCLPVPAFPERWGIRDTIIRGEVIPVLQAVAAKKGLTTIDLYTPLAGRKELFPDRIHPNAAGAAVMVKEIRRVIAGKPSAGAKAPAAPPFEGKKTTWHGFDRYTFDRHGRTCLVIVPRQAAPGKPWVWRARFFGHEPQTDVALLKLGYHVAYVDVAGLFGAPKAVSIWDDYYQFLTTTRGLSRKPALEGMSRGGLIIYNWAKANPTKVSCIYADAPVCDIRSWPGGKGKGKGGGRTWQQCLTIYGITEAESENFKGNPIDGLAPLAKAGVPLLHICGAADDVVPVAENTQILAERYRKLGGTIEVVIKKGVGHHPHSLKDPAPIVKFITANTKVK